MAKAKIKIVTANKAFTDQQLDTLRRTLNCLKMEQYNFSVSIEINNEDPIEITEYICQKQSGVLKPTLKVKRKTA